MCMSVPHIAVLRMRISTSLWPTCGLGASVIQMPGSRLVLDRVLIPTFYGRSTSDLFDGLPGAGRLLLAHELLDHSHEHRTLWSRQVGAEEDAAFEADDARAVALDRQLEGCGRLAQEGDDSLGAGLQLAERVGFEE